MVVTRAREQAGPLSQRLRAFGAIPVEFPVIAFEPPEPGGDLDRALSNLQRYDWIMFTSANGVHFVVERMRALGLKPEALMELRIGAIGPATAAWLERYGLRSDFVPSEFVAEAVVEQIGDVAGRRILLPRADIAREALPEGLRRRGADVEQVVAYRTVAGRPDENLAPLLRERRIDAVTFTSSSTVRNFFTVLEQMGLAREETLRLLDGVIVAAIGPITARTARDLGLRISIEAEQYTTDGLVEALVEVLGPGE